MSGQRRRCDEAVHDWTGSEPRQCRKDARFYVVEDNKWYCDLHLSAHIRNEVVRLVEANEEAIEAAESRVVEAAVEWADATLLDFPMRNNKLEAAVRDLLALREKKA